MGVRLVSDVAVGERLPVLTVDITRTRVVMGSAASGDWAPAHHDPTFAMVELGVADIFLSTATQDLWFERYVTDWTGPRGRLGRLSLRMRRPITAGSTLVIEGEVASVGVDDLGCGWIGLNLEALLEPDGTGRVDGEVDRAVDRDRVRVVASSAEARVAVPIGPDDDPWSRRGDRWAP